MNASRRARQRLPGQLLAPAALGALLFVMVLVSVSTQSMLVKYLMLGLGIGILAVAALGVELVGTIVMLAAYATAPMYKGLAPSAGSLVTAPDLLIALGFMLLSLRMLAGRPRFHSVYSIGLLLTVVAGFVSAMVTPNSKDSLMHLFTWWIAIFVIPLGLSLWNPARRVVAMLAGAYILGQLVDTGFAIVHDGTGRWTGLSTYPNYFGQAGLLSCALAIFLLGEVPRRLRIYVIGAGLVCLGGVIMSGSRASTVVLAVLLLSIPFVERTARSVLAIGTLGAIGVVALAIYRPTGAGSAIGRLAGSGTAGGSDLARSEGLHGGLQQFFDHPFIGNGMTTEIIFPIHNGPLEVAVSIGILGVLGYMLIQISYVRLLLTNLPLRRLGYVALAYLGLGFTVPGLADRSVWLVVSLGVLALKHPPESSPEDAPFTTEAHPGSTTALVGGTT